MALECRMSTSSKVTMKRLATLMRLGRRIEMSASDDPRPGFIRNQFGSFDDAVATEKLLLGFRELIEMNPSDEHVRYLYAGALSRACQFAESIQMYQSLVKEDGQLSSPSAMLLPVVYWLSGDKLAAQEALNAYNAPFIEKGIAPLHERVEQMFADGAAL